MKDMNMFYAEENKYGLNTTTIRRGNKKERNVSAGNLLRFTTAAARNAFVADDTRHREVLTAAEARKYHATGDLTAAVWEDANSYGAGDYAGYDKFIEPKMIY